MLENPVVLDMAVLVDLVVKWASSVILEIALIWGSSNTKKQGKMVFGKVHGGIVGGILGNLVFGGYLFPNNYY